MKKAKIQELVKRIIISIILFIILLIILLDNNNQNKIPALIIFILIVIGFFIYQLNKKEKLSSRKKRLNRKLKNKKFKKQVIIWSSIGAITIICAIIAVLKINFNVLEDEIKAGQFTPIAKVEELVNGLKLTGRAKNILYASSPQLKDKVAFNGICGHDGDPDAYIAGCYYEINGNEYIDIYNSGADATSLQNAYYNYDNSKKVTLAHEMLHAAYKRLSNQDKDWIEVELNKVFSSNKEIRDELGYYPEAEKYDELYVRAATEIYSLPNNLEEHYKIYFKDRKMIAKMYQDSKQQIDEMLSKADNILAEMNKQEIIMNSTRSIYEYNAAVKEYNRLVEVYNQYIDVFRDTLNKRDSEK